MGRLESRNNTHIGLKKAPSGNHSMDGTNAEYCPVYDATFKEWIEEQAISALASNMKGYKKADIKKEEEEFQKRIKKTDD